MASGYGLGGGTQNGHIASCQLAKQFDIGPSRCFPFWQEVLACYVVNANSEDVKQLVKCKPVLEDYYECLHHKKEVCGPSSIHASYKILHF